MGKDLFSFSLQSIKMGMQCILGADFLAHLISPLMRDEAQVREGGGVAGSAHYK